MRLAQHVQDKTACRSNYGSYQLQVMPIGLMSAPEMLQRMACSLFRSMPYVKICIDDVVLGSSSSPEHIDHLTNACIKIWELGLKVKLSKCEFAKDRIEALGYII